MNSLGTYSGYTLLFDSEVVPEAAFAQQQQAGGAPSGAVLDLGALASFKALQAAEQPDMGTGIEQLEQLLGTAAADPGSALADAQALVREALQTRQRGPAAAAAAGPVRIYRPGASRAAAAAALEGVVAAEGASPRAQQQQQQQQQQGGLPAADGEGAAAAAGEGGALYDDGGCMEGLEEEGVEMVDVPCGEGGHALAAACAALHARTVHAQGAGRPRCLPGPC
jgi:hypothetical protein